MIHHPDKPIPNDDPECPCHLGKNKSDTNGMAICFSSGEDGPHWVTVYEICPYHGHIIPKWTP